MQPSHFQKPEPVHSQPAVAAPELGVVSGWQPRAVLLLVLPFAALYALLQTVDVPSLHLPAFAAGLSVALAMVTYFLRAATPAAACLGGLLAYCYALTPAYPHSAFWLLMATLVLTLGATRLSRKMHAAAYAVSDEPFDFAVAHQAPAMEHKRGRSAAQVAANLGAGALCGALIPAYGEQLAHVALAAALAEAAADTLASEIGSLSSSAPRMLLTGRRAEPGADGAVSLLGTVAALFGAAAIAALAVWLFALAALCGVAIGAAGFAGMLVDSVLGQLLERRGRLHNDMVNFLSTFAAAALGLFAGRFFSEALAQNPQPPQAVADDLVRYALEAQPTRQRNLFRPRRGIHSQPGCLAQHVNTEQVRAVADRDDAVDIV